MGRLEIIFLTDASKSCLWVFLYRSADKFLAQPTSPCIFLFDGESISFDASLVLYIYTYVYI